MAEQAEADVPVRHDRAAALGIALRAGQGGRDGIADDGERLSPSCAAAAGSDTAHSARSITARGAMSARRLNRRPRW